MARYQITVSNIGQVHETTDKTEAQNVYEHYVGLSKRRYGTAAGEVVTLWEDGEPLQEYDVILPPQSTEDCDDWTVSDILNKAA